MLISHFPLPLDYCISTDTDLVCSAFANAAGASEAIWENPLQVAARNKRRGGGNSGGNIADVDMGEEEVHRLLADLVSTSLTSLVLPVVLL